MDHCNVMRYSRSIESIESSRVDRWIIAMLKDTVDLSSRSSRVKLTDRDRSFTSTRSISGVKPECVGYSVKFINKNH